MQRPRDPSAITPSAVQQAAAGKCETTFGREVPTPDGIIAWNGTSGSSYDTAGAADVHCAARTTIKHVLAYGYYGAASETFHVTFYHNDRTDGSNEPNDSR